MVKTRPATLGTPSFATLRTRRSAERRQAALAVLRQAAKLAARHGGRLVVFGSLLETGLSEGCDLDVMVSGLPPDRDNRIAAEIDSLLAKAGFATEVIPERFLPPDLRERVLLLGYDPSALT